MVTARLLLAIFDGVYLLALSAWVGGALSFGFGVLPAVSRVLDREAGGKLLRALLPLYYGWGVVSCAIALPALVCGALAVPQLRGPAIGVQSALIAIGLGIMLHGGSVLTPAMNAALEAGPSDARRFDRLRRRSTWLDGLSLLIGAALLIGFAARKPPTTAGIVEPPPRRAAFDGRP